MAVPLPGGPKVGSRTTEFARKGALDPSCAAALLQGVSGTERECRRVVAAQSAGGGGISPALAGLDAGLRAPRGPAHPVAAGKEWSGGEFYSKSFALCYAWAADGEKCWVNLDPDARQALLPALAAAIARAPPDADLAGAAGGLFHAIAWRGMRSGFEAFALAAAAARARGGECRTAFDAWFAHEFLYYAKIVLSNCEIPGVSSESASCALGVLVEAAAGDEALLARCADSVTALPALSMLRNPAMLACMRRLLPPTIWRTAVARALEPARAALEKMRADGRSQEAIASAEDCVGELELVARA